MKQQTQLSGQFVSFTLAKEEYAVDIFKVLEVINPPKITQVPNMPDFIPGVINLRGNVTPVVDLRKKLGMKSTEQTLDSRILIVELELDGQLNYIGLIADKVSKVIQIETDQIQQTPEMGTRIRSEFLHGMAEMDAEQFILLLNIEKVLASDTLMEVIRKAENDSNEAEDDESSTMQTEGDADLKKESEINTDNN